MRGFLQGVVRVLGSYALAVTILVLLLVLTFLGTIAQKHQSIYDVQRTYFEGLLVVRPEPWEGWRLPIVLPGAALLLGLLFVNLVVGGIVRLKKRLSKAFILVTHLGILWLLAAGLVEHLFSTKGHLSLFEGESSDEYQSYFDWDLVVVEHLDGGRVREHVVPHDRMGDLDPDESARFESAALPFDLRVSGYERNAGVVAAAPGEGVDGVVVVPLPPDRSKAEANVPALVLTATEKAAGGRVHHSVLHGAQKYPWAIRVGEGASERRYDLDLRRRRWTVPYRIRLDRAVGDMHPGTNRPREYSSYVTQLRGASARAVHITMNQPLRDQGFTFFQSTFKAAHVDEEDGRFRPTESGFAVVRNPADQWPKWACWVIGIGLLGHMLWKLVLYVRAERNRRRHAAVP